MSKARWKKAADETHLPLGDRTMTYNSRLAQELGKWAESKGKGDAFHDAVFRAYFADGKNIGKIQILVDLAVSVGLSGNEAQKVLQTRAFRTAVDFDWSRSLEIDPELVPTLMINGRMLVNPQKYELFEQFMISNKVKRRNLNA